MPRKMTAADWRVFERAVVSFCELRAEYRRRKAEGTLGTALEQRMIQDLNALEIHIERIRSGNELELARKADCMQAIKTIPQQPAAIAAM